MSWAQVNLRAPSMALAVMAAGLATPAGLAAPVSVATQVKPYLVPVGSTYTVAPLLSVADRVAETGDPTRLYQMVGIPDGLGAYQGVFGPVNLLMSHEFGKGTSSEPFVGRPRNRGAIVSRWLLDRNGNVLSGDRAYDWVYMEDTLVGPAAQENNATPAFARFCSASLPGREAGFDRPIYLAGEEAVSPDTFDGKGGLTVAVLGNEARALPKLGRFSKENNLVMPNTGTQTVIMSLEDGPSTPDSQLYLYVGQKDRSSPSPLSRNGLNNGNLYVFVSTTPGKFDELSFQEGTISGRWEQIEGAEDMTDVQLEAAVDAAGAFGFVRIEDGAFSKTHGNQFFFVTTGGNPGAGNALGRLYALTLNSGNPVGAARLQVVYNADHVIEDGGDIAISPDNLDTSTEYLMVQEDGTSQSRPIMEQKGRDGSIWRFNLRMGLAGQWVDVDSALRVAELDPPGRDGIPVGAGIWESSGILDASQWFGAGSWLLDVQAHPPTTPPAPNTVEDGQLLLMVPAGN
ncbi:MAG: alkaline phosphatase PhoX [Actinomycetota bacterium]